ncbi:Tape measure domain protein [uncultured Dysgonomonas sp.]|uniref:Tape measure domain protein n=1 Tax=uncultured Dysgonomonas sp. TaxID=206096 RepID=A0A212JWT0_9BACT|nr:tape measure protein [uncultured Dysgonomonas sp.]SBW03867.1 Tape measure domain protein [uncultured Dysgonomonas sp.]
MSEIIDGGLGFRATLDIDDFNVSAETMERRIRTVSNTSVYESDRMEQSILSFAQNGAKYLVSYLIGNGLSNVLNSIIQVRGQFQQLDIAFETMLGNTAKSKALMDQLVDTAAKTPFDLMGVAGGAKQLLAYGTAADKVNDTLVRLGNIASGLSIPLNDIVYLYGTTQVQGRLYAQDVRQFTGRGIPLVRELAEMYGKTAEEINEMVSAGKIGFDDVEKVILKMTNSEGQFFNLMEKQSASLTGMIANLGDSWDMALNKLGEDNQDVFATGIEGATYLVEHLDDILRIVKAISIAYGTYKAAVVLNTLATKGYTGVSLIDNTVRQAKISLMKVEENLSGRTAAKTIAMTTAEKAHTAALEAQLTTEEKANVVKAIRISTIQSLLTVQQQEYLSNLGLTASSQGYEAAVMGVLSVEQRESLSKLDLTSKSAIYRAELAREVAAKNQNKIASLDLMRTEVRNAAARVEAAKQTAVATMQATEAMRYEVYWAKQSGDATRIATAEKRYLAAQENQAIARKAALAAQTDFHTKKKALETVATRTGTAASVTDNVVTDAQIVKKSLLSTVTTGLIVKLKALWATMLANPFTAILSVVGLVISAFTLFGKKQDEATDAAKEFEAQTKKEMDSIRILTSIINTANNGTKARKDAIDKLNKILGDYNLELLKESATVDEVSKKYEELTKAIKESTAERLKAQGLENLNNKKAEKDKVALDDFKSNIGGIRNYEAKSGGTAGIYTQISIPKWVQEMDDQVYEFLETNITESAQKIANLTGAEYQKAYQDLKNKTLETLSKTTGATDIELKKANSYVDEFIDHHIKSVQRLSKETTELTGKMEAAGAIWATPPKTVSVDYMTRSFSDLDKIVKDTQYEIEKINSKPLKVSTDNSRLLELLGVLGQVQSAIGTKETNLNTESGINSRIKQLQDERANVDVNSKKYRELTATITGLQKKLPDNSKNAGENAIRKQEQLAEKQLQVDMKLEQARIDIMDDGYEKRKAILYLQHKKNLADIDKEEKDLLKARKEAGKGGLSSSEKKGFDDRRNLENQSYTKDQNKLFDGEIDYKKKQYELYFRWVKNMGKDVADTQFSNLLKGGSSYKDYIEKQIQDLNQKKSSGSLTEGESNHLIALNVQYDEIRGAKTAMDSFKESVTQAIGRAATLAEKIQAIADAKERLSNGSTGLVGADEQAEANLFVSKEEEDANKELQDKLLSDFRTFEEQKKSIQDEYALLRNSAMAQNNATLLAEINKGEAEALSTLNAQMLMQTDSWKNLFTDLDALTVEQIDKLINEIQTKMSTADLNLNPADLKAVLDKLDEAKRKILDVNPFKALGNAIKGVFGTAEQKSKHSSGDIKKDWSNLATATEGTFDFINDAIDGCDVLSDLIGESGKQTIQMVQGVAMAGIAMAAAIKTAEKGSIVLAAIGVALQVVTVIASLFNNDDKLEKRIQKIQANIDALSNSFDRLSSAVGRTYWEYNDQEKDAHDKRLNAIKEQIAALEQQASVAKASWNFVQYAQLVKQIKDLRYQLEKAEQSGDMFQLYELQKRNLREQQELIKQQIQAEKDKKKTDNGKIADWEEQIKDIDSQLEDLERSMLETLAGTDVKSAIDEFADALVDAYVQGEDAAKALGEVTKEVMKKAVVEAIKRQFLAKAINDAVEYLGESMKDGVLDDKERAKFESMVNAAGDATKKALESVGDWIKDIEEDATEDPLTGAVRGLSEETGSLVAGRLNAVVINQSDYLSVMRQSLIYHQQTAANTGISARELTEIRTTLNTIKNSMGNNSLLSQGIS